MKSEITGAKIMIVDDQAPNVRLLEQLLQQEGYANVVGTTDSRQAEDLFRSYKPDLLMLDLRMPHVDGFEVMRRLSPHIDRDAGGYLPVLVLTADSRSGVKQEALEAGAKDFITKPFDPVEVLLRIKNLLETRILYRHIREQNETLEIKVQHRTRELWAAIAELEEAKADLRFSREETIQRLSIAAEYRDDETSMHIQRMSLYCEILARAAGFDAEQVERMRLASQMHDVGKIGTPDEILLKAGPLTDGERAIMQQHTEIGYRILSKSKSEILQLASVLALSHHERIDGTGYPAGLSGDEIPVEGRVASVADVFDALTTDRIYRRAFDLPSAVELMKKGRGTQFDPDLLDLFFESLPEIIRAKERYEDESLDREIRLTRLVESAAS